jgi:DNA (cytosine-5)-methyltransferase 1
LASPKTLYRVVDLFCGCGGLSRGLERTGRFSTVFGVDIDPAALNTFQRNHGMAAGRPPSVWCGDIRDLSIGVIQETLSNHGITKRGDLDCLVGGPPCEGFSRNKVYTDIHEARNLKIDRRALAPKQYRERKYWQSAWQAPARASTLLPKGRAVQAYNPFLDDPRNNLFRWFLDVADAFRPKVILIENVRQILQHRDGEIAREIVERLENLGYSAASKVLNAAEFGVPQLRYRAFFIAARKDLLADGGALPWPNATHHSAREDDLFRATDVFPGDQGLFVTVREAIADLPPAIAQRSVETVERHALEIYPRAPLSKFRGFVRSLTASPANHIYRTPSEQVMARMRAMQPGMKPHDLPRELQTKKYYYNAYGRLEWDQPANTITKSFLYPGSGKFGHPSQDRIISYREAARLQAFDDDFTFYASSQESLAHMIGSAVPPLVGFQFGRRFAAFLDERRAATSSAGVKRKFSRPVRAGRQS